jgi:hypothetical protein
MTESSTTVTPSDMSLVPSQRDKEILELIDRAIRECTGRDIVSATEMTDLLLDIRLYMMTSTEVVLEH